MPLKPTQLSRVITSFPHYKNKGYIEAEGNEKKTKNILKRYLYLVEGRKFQTSHIEYLNTCTNQSSILPWCIRLQNSNHKSPLETENMDRVQDCINYSSNTNQYNTISVFIHLDVWLHIVVDLQNDMIPLSDNKSNNWNTSHKLTQEIGIQIKVRNCWT